MPGSPVTVADLAQAAQGVQVKRDELDAWCNDPKFDGTIPGTFVRVLMDEESSARKYAIGRVIRVTQAQTAYHFGNLTRTSKELELEFGNQRGNFQMNTVSNSVISPVEFQSWWTNMLAGQPAQANADVVLQNMRGVKLTLNQFREKFQQGPRHGNHGDTGTVIKPSGPRGTAAKGSHAGSAINSDELVAELRAEIAKYKEQLNHFPAPTAFAAMTTPELQGLEQRVESYRQSVREAIEERRKCIVCYEKHTNVIFLPCKHQCACEECSAKLKECPMCRSAITDRIKPFGA